MGLESATYIEDLVQTNPLGTDGKSQGDNHLRLIKQVLKNQFPNLGSAAVTGTAAELNAAVAGATPEGGIIMWSGTTAQVPTGWQLCNGTGTTNNLSIAVPNLTGKFIIGSITDTGGTYDIGDTGGSTDITGTSEAHELTEAELPAHFHYMATDIRRSIFDGGLLASNYLAAYGDSGGNGAYSSAGTGNVADVGKTSSAGTGDAHTHGVSLAGANIPPYYALAYIIYLG